MGQHRKTVVATPARVLSVGALVVTAAAVVQDVRKPEEIPAPVVVEPSPVAFPAAISVAPDVLPAVAPAAVATSYTVASGDTLAKIADRVGQSADDLVGRNRAKVPDPDVVRVGQVLSLTGPVEPAPPRSSPRHRAADAPSPAAAIRARVEERKEKKVEKREEKVEKKTEEKVEAALARGASAIPGIAKTFVGIKYVYGGKSRATGLDCSGFVYNVLKQAGLSNTYRTSDSLRSWTRSVPKSQARAGDLVFGPGHVGIYLGDGMMIDAPRPGKTIQVRKVYSTMTSYGRIPA